MKRIHEILQDPLFAIPQKYDGSKQDFRAFIITKLSKYQDEIETCVASLKTPFSKILFDKLKESNEQIINSINYYSNGSPHKSYEVFSSYLSKLKSYDLLPTKTISENTSLFRIRNTSSTRLEIKEIFHPPINKRTKISNQRFSIAGYPTLYLANSLYVAWEEMGRPKLEEIFFSLFKPTAEFQVLDFTFQCYNNLIDTTSDEQNLQRLCIMYPLYFLSTIVVSEKLDSFKPEYIFSQFVLGWVKDNFDKVKGIAYASTRVNENSKGTFFNIALPISFVYKDASPLSPSYCADLASRFFCTEPLNVKLIQSEVAHFKAVISKYLSKDINSIFSFDTYDLIPFEQSFFHKVEMILESKTLHLIQDNI